MLHFSAFFSFRFYWTNLKLRYVIVDKCLLVEIIFFTISRAVFFGYGIVSTGNGMVMNV